MSKLKHINHTAKYFIEPFLNNRNFKFSIEVKADPWDLKKPDSGTKITNFKGNNFPSHIASAPNQKDASHQ